MNTYVNTKNLSSHKRIIKLVKKQRALLFLLVVPMLFLLIFQYVPMYGILIAFKDYKYSKGIIGSEWNNFEYFKRLFKDIFFLRALKNTVIISLLNNFTLGFILPIVFALLLNEIRNLKFKKIVQSISYLPHFMSWVAVSVIVTNILSPERGIVVDILESLGFDPGVMLANKKMFIPILLISDLWKSIGWSSIIYIAAMSSTNPQLYESAQIDGANRYQQAIHITIPSILPIITIVLILRIGSILNAGFDQIINLYNSSVYEVADILDTYMYRLGIENAKYGLSTAMGLFKNVIGVALIIGTNMIVKRFSDYGVW